MSMLHRHEKDPGGTLAREQLSALRRELSDAYEIFNRTLDPQLLEASILEISALHARYSSVLKSLKSLNGEKEK